MLQTCVCVLLMTKSVVKQKTHLFSWLLKLEKQIESLTSRPERCIDDAMRKLMNISNIAQRFKNKSTAKDKVIGDAIRLKEMSCDLNELSFVSKLTNDWNRIAIALEKETNRLNSLASTWKEFKSLAQCLEQDLARFLLSVDTSIEHITVEHILLERELLVKVKKQLRKKEKVRDQLKVFRDNILLNSMEKSSTLIDERLATIDSLWFELQSKISDRLRVLSDVKSELEWIVVNETMLEVRKRISSGEELLDMYASPVSLTPQEVEEGLLLLHVRIICFVKW